MLKIKQNLKLDLIVFILISLILFLLCVFLKFPNPDFDFMNYHRYIGYAFWNNRITTDFMSANYHSYLNPYIDAWLYLLISKLNNHPYLFFALSAFDNAVFLFMVYKISKYLLKITHKFKYILLTVLYAAFSPIMIDSLNFGMNDALVGSFVLISFYLAIKHLFKASQNRLKYIFISGLIMGVGAALKLTVLFYCLTIFLSMLIMDKKFPNPFKTLACWTSGAIISFFITDGYWLWTMFTYFQNPLFPYYNNIFHSPYFDNMDINKIVYSNTVPRNVFEFIFYPFLYSYRYVFGNYHLDWDPRYAINFVCVLMLCLKLILKKNIKFINREHLCFLLLFVTLSFYINNGFAAVYRFIISSSALYGLILLVTLLNFVSKKKSLIIFIIFILFAYTNNTYNTQYTFREQFKEKNLIVKNKDINVPDNSAVIFVDNGLSYLVPELNQNSKYYGFVVPQPLFDKYKTDLGSEDDIYFNNRVWFSNYLETRLADLINDKNNKIYVGFYYRENIPVYEIFLNHYSKNKRKIENCSEIYINGAIAYNTSALLCEYNLKD